MRRFARSTLLVALATALALPAHAQTVGTYTEQSGTVRNQIAVVPVGTVAPGSATDSSAPTKVGCPVISGVPTYTTGTMNACSLNTFGGVRVAVSGNGSDVLVLSTTADANGTSVSSLWTFAQSAIYNGNSWDRQRGDVNGTVIQPALSSAYWSFASAASGIVNTTTAVTIKAASGAGVRNYLCTVTIDHDLLGAATEFAVRDGAAGTVLARFKLPTTAKEGSLYTFSPCLKGTANTQMEVVTLTATVSGGVYVNGSGFTGI